MALIPGESAAISDTEKANHHPEPDSEADPDELFAALEAEDDAPFRAARAQQLASDYIALRPNAVTSASEQVYETLRSDEEVLKFTTNSPRAIVHFSHEGFARCGTMDEHLRCLAELHAREGEEVKFGRVDVKHAEFVVQRLAIRMLPCVVGFVDGEAKGRIVGFEGVCWGSNEGGKEVTKEIEGMSMRWGVLTKMLMSARKDDESGSEDEEKAEMSGFARKGIRGKTRDTADEDDDWD